MSFTAVFTNLVEISETLARRTLSKAFASWSFNNSDVQIVNVAQGATVQLPAYTLYQFSADPLAPVVVGWIFNSNVVEVQLNQLTVITPPATPYLRNTSTDVASSPVPVQVLAFS